MFLGDNIGIHDYYLVKITYRKPSLVCEILSPARSESAWADELFAWGL